MEFTDGVVEVLPIPDETIAGFKVGAGELFEHAEREMRLLND